MPKELAVSTYDFTFWVERWDGRAWIHLDVHRWCKRVRAAVIAEVAALARRYGTIWTTHFVGDTKHEKFLRLIGGERVGPFAQYEGRDVEVWKREG